MRTRIFLLLSTSNITGSLFIEVETHADTFDVRVCLRVCVKYTLKLFQQFNILGRLSSLI